VEGLDEHVDAAAAHESDGKGIFVAVAETLHRGAASGKRVLTRLEHGPFDAAAGEGADDSAGGLDEHRCSRRARDRALGRDDRRDRDILRLLRVEEPRRSGRENVEHGPRLYRRRRSHRAWLAEGGAIGADVEL
jgi:hypothetical protein